MQRFFIFFLIAILLLPGCSRKTPAPPVESQAPAQDTTLKPENLSAFDLLADMLSVIPEGKEDPEIVNEEDLPLYFGLYGLPQEYVNTCAVARLGGTRVFELAVIDLTQRSAAAEAGLLSYLTRRWADFGGYAPDQAEIAKEGTLYSVDSGHRLILSLSQDNQAVEQALICAGYDSLTVITEVADWTETIPSPTPSPSPDPSEEPGYQPSEEPTPEPSVPGDRLPFVAPNIDDMTIYDTSAILEAWRSGDSSLLSDYDRAILDKASQVLDECLTDGMSDLERETALYRWITANVKYDYDHYDVSAQLSPDSSTPYNPLINGKGICLGFSVTFQLLMDMADVECITVIGAANHSLEDHAWNMVRLNGNWYCVDSTWDAGVLQVFWRYFNVTSDYLALHSHQWDYGSVPEATADDYGRCE